MRDHIPVLLEQFNGLWKRGDADSTPLDHFSNCNNIQFSESSFLTRYGLAPELPYKNVVRLSVFNQSLLVLDKDGNLYHTDRSNRYTPILHLDGMTDFFAVKYANRVYISPSAAITDYIYVYKYGDTNGARKAGGNPPSIAPVLSLGAAGSGNCEQGVHVVAVVYETDTGFLTQLSPKAQISVPDGGYTINVDLPTSPDSFVTKRHVVVTKAIDPADFTGNLDGYEFFFIDGDGGLVNDNTTATAAISFYDAELLEDASYLEDLYNPIPNCIGINIYHNRLIGWYPHDGSTPDRLSDIILSFPGEPEAIAKTDGLISLQPDGRSITYCQEFRDSLYILKGTKTWVSNDNGDVPATWPVIIIDNGIGSGPRGVATIMDSGGVNVEYLVVADYTGLLLFDGKYNLPELSWKIKDMWRGFPHTTFDKTQTVIDSQNHIIYIVFPDGTMAIGDYNDGLDAKSIKWAPWSFNIKATTVVIIEEGGIRVVIGTKEAA